MIDGYTWMHMMYRHDKTQSNLYIKGTQGKNWKNTLYEQFVNEKNEIAPYKVICYTELPFMEGLTVFEI